MTRNNGLERVLEPKGFVPATAFKLDNSKELKNKEIRIRLERIHIEWDHFRQICNSCGCDDASIKGKILGVVKTHGKVHNPFSRSGGAVAGTIEEIGSEVKLQDDISEGTRVCYIAPLNSVPLYIESIKDIDFNYGQLICTGYAILFDTEKIVPVPNDLATDYTLSVLNEGGSIYAVHTLSASRKNKNIVILGRNEHTALFYASALDIKFDEDCNITCIMDDSANDFFTHEEVHNFLDPYVRQTYFVDVHDPLTTFETLKKDPLVQNPDMVIVAEDIPGADTLAVMLVKPDGDIFFTSPEIHYSDSQVVADSLNKKVNLIPFTECLNDYSTYIIDLIRSIRPKLKEIDNRFHERNEEAFSSGRVSHRIKMPSAGKDDEFVYQSAVTEKMVDEILNIAKFDCNVIIQGETGVGKEKVLSLIHQHSMRSTKPCVKINCATIQENLAESEFFGYESGAFTGAQASGKIGYFELANNGTLFLDEIGSLSLNMQSKLLRVLQENQFYRVGGTTQINVDVRVICANNVPLQEIVERGEFREDLYYRLNICKINVPPLRERRDDILCLSEAFVSNCTRKYKIEKELSDNALRALYNYSWPGNVRELENVIHRLIISSKDTIIDSEDVDSIINEAIYHDKAFPAGDKLDDMDSIDFHQYMEAQEKKLIEYALKKEGTTRKAADLIGLPQTTFARKKLKYGL